MTDGNGPQAEAFEPLTDQDQQARPLADEPDAATGSIGTVLRGLRIDLGLSREDLSERLYKIGYPIDASTLAKYETGSRRLSAHFIPFVSAALKLTPEEEDTLLRAFVASIVLDIQHDYLDAKKQLANSME